MSTSGLDIIRAEHRSLASVLHALQYLARQIRDAGATPDYGLLRLIIDYIEEFHQRYHHPKEDEYLFRAIRTRTQEADVPLAVLEAEHAEGDGRLRSLRAALNRLQASNGAASADLGRAVDDYSEFHWRHMRREEDEVMPIAERVLTAQDWAAMNAAFTANDDPLFGQARREEFEALFKLIVNLAPPPIGYGATS